MDRNAALDAQQPESEKRRRRSERLEYPLPTNRLALQRQLDLLRAYGALSGEGKNPVRVAEAARVVGIHPATATLTTGFFLGAGLLQRERGGLKPTEPVLEFHRAWTWDPTRAAIKLQPALRETWAWKLLEPRLETRRSLSEEEAISALAEKAKVGKEYEPQLKVLLGFLEAAGLLQRNGGQLSIGQEKPLSAVAPAASETPPQREPPGSCEEPAASGAAPRVVEAEAILGGTVHPALAGLLQLLPKAGSAWSRRAKERWLTAFQATIELLYPEEDRAEQRGAEGAREESLDESQ